MHVWNIKYENVKIHDPPMMHGIAITSLYMTQWQGVKDFQIKLHINYLTFGTKFMMHCTPIHKEMDQHHLNVSANVVCFFRARGILEYPL